MNIAIVGATGNVGRKILEVLEKKNFRVDNLHLLASTKSLGSSLNFKGKDIKIELLENFDFSKVDLTFFSAGGKISEKFAPKAAKNSIVVDNSSFFRMDPEVPLIVPQVNPNDMKNIPKNIIANPNCSTAQLVIVLKPLHDSYKIKRVVDNMTVIDYSTGSLRSYSSLSYDSNGSYFDLDMSILEPNYLYEIFRPKNSFIY